MINQDAVQSTQSKVPPYQPIIGTVMSYDPQTHTCKIKVFNQTIIENVPIITPSGIKDKEKVYGTFWTPQKEDSVICIPILPGYGNYCILGSFFRSGISSSDQSTSTEYDPKDSNRTAEIAMVSASGCVIQLTTAGEIKLTTAGDNASIIHLKENEIIMNTKDGGEIKIVGSEITLNSVLKITK